MMCVAFWLSLLLWVQFLKVYGFALVPWNCIQGKCRYGDQKHRSVLFSRTNLPRVWVEPAEDDFVEQDENLEDGEICLLSVKAFASSSSSSSNEDDDVEERLFLCAGALVQRPDSRVCDAWTADSLLGGTNLQYKGATQVLDKLLLFHLQNQHQQDQQTYDDNNPIDGLQTFVLRCGSSFDSEYTCASYMAGQGRGFRPLKELLREDSIYTPSLYDSDFEGMVIDYHLCKERYEEALSTIASSSSNLSHENVEDSSFSSSRSTIMQILKMLPDIDTIRRHTTKRYNIRP